MMNISQMKPCVRGEKVIEEIEQILITSMGDFPNFPMLASAFNMSGRTLRRQLANMGTSYQKLLDDFRSERAKYYLTDSQYTTEEIADKLGFSDVANFRHAFKKWVGVSPAVYRNTQHSTELAQAS
ncbi:helix-turn-helix transcriptional regulator [Bermanella marisrubri]|uniref:Transcriptional regulator OruR n=1 Tax=Bermanella marisrubri TaxID=207949 RepID=Q1N1V2_9GAMM|nr:helix-turn-helix transcriptional regulator [Bermanella marisrubri]EAT12179.1 transcriptional regulator OruR [Oceanobacter sp. RED65] [Bermanella marisrubri]QIZ83653.1 helix-turn-helix transcriptional regulator [Bermanella marisrubri]